MRLFFVPTTLLASMWLLLSNGNLSSWVVGLPAIAAAVWASRSLNSAKSGTLSIPGLVVFIPFFIWESIRGGFDVLKRVLRPKMKINPGFLTYEVSLKGKQARLIFVNSVSLLPGTLAADLGLNSLKIHALDVSTDSTVELNRLEKVVGQLYQEEDFVDG